MDLCVGNLKATIEVAMVTVRSTYTWVGGLGPERGSVRDGHLTGDRNCRQHDGRADATVGSPSVT